MEKAPEAELLAKMNKNKKKKRKRYKTGPRSVPRTRLAQKHKHKRIDPIFYLNMYPNVKSEFRVL